MNDQCEICRAPSTVTAVYVGGVENPPPPVHTGTIRCRLCDECAKDGPPPGWKYEWPSDAEALATADKAIEKLDEILSNNPFAPIKKYDVS